MGVQPHSGTSLTCRIHRGDEGCQSNWVRGSIKLHDTYTGTVDERVGQVPEWILRPKVTSQDNNQAWHCNDQVVAVTLRAKQHCVGRDNTPQSFVCCVGGLFADGSGIA